MLRTGGIEEKSCYARNDDFSILGLTTDEKHNIVFRVLKRDDHNCIILLRDIISNFTESWTFIMGILFMAAVLGFRGGIIGILRNKLRLSI